MLLPFVARAGNADEAAPPPFLKPFERKAFLPAVGVTSLAQTNDGLLWVGTADALLRFDGNQFAAWPMSPNAAEFHQRIRRLFADARGNRLLVVPGDGDLSVWPAGVASYEVASLAQTTPAGSTLFQVASQGHKSSVVALGAPHILAVATDLEETAWLGTDQGLWRVRPGDASALPKQAFTKQNGLAANAVGALAFDGHSTLWVGTEAGLQRLVDGQLRSFDIREPVLGIATNSLGDTMVRTHRELLWLRSDQVMARAEASSHPAISRAAAGGFWVAFTDKVSRMIMAGSSLVEADRIDVASATAVLEDSEGSVWIGTRAAGLFQQRRQRVWNKGAGDGLGGYAAFAILRAHDGSHWITTTLGLSHVVGSQIKVFSSGNNDHNIPGWGLRGLAQTRAGQVFVNSLSHGVIVQSAGGWMRGSQFHTLLAKGTTAVFTAPNDDLWVGLANGDLARFSGAEFNNPKIFAAKDNECLQSPSSFANDDQGTLYLGSRGGGLAKIVGDAVTCYGPATGGKPFKNIASLMVTPKGSVWMGGQPGGGLMRLQTGRFDRVPSDLPPDTIGALVVTGDFVWITSSEHGAFRARLQDMEDAADSVATGRNDAFLTTHWSAKDGLSNQVCTAWNQPAAALDNDGRLWVPTQLGISVIDPPERRPTALPHVSIDQMWINGHPQEIAGRLGPGPINLKVAVLAPSLAYPESLWLGAKLEGRDDDWAPLHERAAEWNQLLPGHYSLSVRSVMPGLAAVTTVVGAFDVAAPFWRTGWFVSALGVSVVLLGLLAWFLRDQHLLAKFQAVQTERMNLARDLHDGLAQGFASLGLLIDSLELKSADLPAPTRLLLNRARHVLDRFQDDARRTIWELRSQNFQTLSLGEAMDKAVQAARFTADVRIAILGTPALTRQALHELPLIAREATSNAIRHGQATVIDIEIEAGPANATLTIEDNGTGFPAHATDVERPHFGLQGMRERAARINAEINIESMPGRGVRIVVTIPTVLDAHTP